MRFMLILVAGLIVIGLAASMLFFTGSGADDQVAGGSTPRSHASNPREIIAPGPDLEPDAFVC